MLKMAVFGPMPRMSAAITASENPGVFLSIRTANRRSDHKAFMWLFHGKSPANDKLAESTPLVRIGSYTMFNFGTHASGLEQIRKVSAGNSITDRDLSTSVCRRGVDAQFLILHRLECGISAPTTCR